MAMLMTQFAQMGATPLVKSSYDISTDDLEQHNVILLGSSAENLAVAQIVPTGDFLFEGPVSSRDPWSNQVLNSKPRVRVPLLPRFWCSCRPLQEITCVSHL